VGNVLTPLPLTPQGFLKPWSLRNRIAPQGTYSGRIVYKRRPHFFTLRDIERISERFDLPPGEIIEEPDTWAGRLVRAVWNVIFKIVPVPGLLSPYIEPLVHWYTRIVNAASTPGTQSTFEYWAKRANRSLMGDLASAFGESLAQFVKENP
jgi:hypothetical protein